MGCIVINFYTRERVEVDEHGRKIPDKVPKNEPSKLESDRKEHNERVKRQYKLTKD